MKAYKTGQHVKHSQYGTGVILRSDEDRTSIDFVDHGMKLFVTSLVKLEAITPEEISPASKRTSRSRRRSSKRRSPTKVAAR